MKDEPKADFFLYLEQFHLYIRTNDTEKLEKLMANRKRLVAKMAMRRHRDRRKKWRETGLQEAASSPSPPLINEASLAPSSPAVPTLADPSSMSPEELKAEINNNLNKKPLVLVLSCDFVGQKRELGCCCITIHDNNQVDIEGDISSRPLYWF